MSYDSVDLLSEKGHMILRYVSQGVDVKACQKKNRADPSSRRCVDYEGVAIHARWVYPTAVNVESVDDPLPVVSCALFYGARECCGCEGSTD